MAGLITPEEFAKGCQQGITPEEFERGIQVTGAPAQPRRPSPAPLEERVEGAASSALPAAAPAPRSPASPPVKFHSIVEQPIDSAGKAWSASCWKAAAIGVLVLFGAIACTGVALASLYAPGALPFVVIAVLFFMISQSLGVSNISNWCMKHHNEYEKEQKEDLFIEERLKEWENLAFDQAVAHVANSQKDQLPPGDLSTIRGLHERPAAQNRLKPLFARFLYFISESQEMDNLIDKDKKHLENLRNGYETEKKKWIRGSAEILELMEKADPDADLSALNREFRQREMEIAETTDHLRGCLESSSYFHRCAAVYLYILRHPINRVDPTISQLTWDTLFLPPLPIPEETRRTTRFEYLPSRRLRDGTGLPIAEAIDTPVAELSDRIHRSVQCHLKNAKAKAKAVEQRRAAATATQPTGGTVFA